MRSLGSFFTIDDFRRFRVYRIAAPRRYLFQPHG